MQPILMKQGDRLPALNVTATTSGDIAYNLTGASVVFNMRNTQDGTVKVNRAAATLVDGAAGTLRYEWGANDLDTVGLFECEFECTISGKRLSVPSNGFILVRVLDDIA